MSASKFVHQAEIESNGSGGKHGCVQYQHKRGHRSLNRGKCACHPPAWGLKKGLRRGRRRFSKIIIEREISENDVGQESEANVQALQG